MTTATAEVKQSVDRFIDTFNRIRNEVAKFIVGQDDMAYLPNGTNRLAFYCQVASSFAKPREVDLVVARIDEQGGEQLMKVIPLEIKPGLNPPETFTLENALPGKWIARLKIDDALPQDNVAHLAAIRPDAVRVGVKSEDRFFLEKSVLAFSKSDGLLTLVQDKADVVLANESVPEGDKLLLFHPKGAAPWWKDVGEVVEVAAPRVMVKNHPARVRYLDVTSMPFVGARQIDRAAGRSDPRCRRSWPAADLHDQA